MDRQRITLAAVFALSFAGRARAASPAELMSCFAALSGPGEDNRPLSEGRGQDLSAWEWAPPKLYASIAVAERRGGREGFYFYGDAGAEFYSFDTPKIPQAYKTGSYRSIPLEIRPRGEGRGIFHCVYRAVDVPGDRPGLDCDLTNRAGKYYPPAREELKGSDADWAALKTAVLERVMSVHAVFAGRAKRYADSLETWRRRNAEPRPAWSSLAGYAGVDTSWYFAQPSVPLREAARKALAACGAIDDETLGGAARTEARLLESARTTGE
jgi:hypothetical protein